jgi:DnaJ-class molecular chaperone
MYHTTKTVTCSYCNGYGTVTYWNSYYGQYETVTCSQCGGTGKVSSN